MEMYRNLCIIGPFVKMYKSLGPRYTSVKIYGMFLDDRDPRAIQRKALALYGMKIGWLKLMGIPLLSKN